MSAKLNDDDRRAVDLWMSAHTASATPDGNGHNGRQVASGRVADRVRTVGKLLQRLDALPAAEPPRDLKLKTLRRIEDAIGEPLPTTPRPQPHPYTGAQRPA